MRVANHITVKRTLGTGIIAQSAAIEKGSPSEIPVAIYIAAQQTPARGRHAISR